MRPPLLLVFINLLLLLSLLSTISQAINLKDKDYFISSKKKEINEGTMMGGENGVEHGDSHGEIYEGDYYKMGKRSRDSRVRGGVQHRLLMFDVDYYGPGDHKSKHH